MPQLLAMVKRFWNRRSTSGGSSLNETFAKDGLPFSDLNISC